MSSVYDKLDGAYFAEFVQDNFENMFRIANKKMGHVCLYRKTVLFKIARQHAMRYMLKKQSS